MSEEATTQHAIARPQLDAASDDPSATGPHARTDDTATEPSTPKQSFITACTAELDTKPEPARAARLHYEIGRCLDDQIAALKRFDEALELQSDYLPAIQAARRLHLDNGRVKAALPMFDAELRLLNEPQQRARLLLERARALEDIAHDHEAARDVYREAMELDPSALALLKGLQQLEAHAESWDALAVARAHEANAVTDPRHRAALLIERARLLEARLDRTDEATQLYQQALDLDGEACGALQALKRLLHTQGRWRELIDVLEREAEQAESTEVQTLALFRIGRIHSERLDDRVSAVAALARATQLAPNDRLVLESLARLYEYRGDHENLAHALAHTVETMGTARERLGMIHRIGAIYEQRLGKPEAAQQWYEAALQIDAAYQPALDALDGLYRAHEHWEALIVMHLGAAEATQDAMQRAQAHAHIAEIFETRVGNHGEASRHYLRALSLDPEHEASFKALTRLYAQAGQHRELIELYSRQLDRPHDDDVVIAYLFRIGALYEDDLSDPLEAMHAYRRILDRKPDHLGALHAQQRAAEAAGRYQDLVDALETEAALRKEPERVVALLHRAGEVRALHLNDESTAIARFKRVLQLQDDYTPALTSLARLYHSMGRSQDLLLVYEAELRSVTDEAQRVELLYKMGELCDKQLGQVDAAISHYRRAIAIDPSHGPTLRALQRKLRERGDFKGLVGALQNELVGSATAQAKARTCYRLGEVYEVHVHDRERAAAAYAQALEFVAEYRPAVDALSRVKTELAKWSELATDLEGEAKRVGEPRLAIEALLRAGQIWSERLGNGPRAIVAHEAVLSIEPDNLAALLALEPLYRKACAWEKLAQTYGAQAKRVEGSAAKVAALCELARVQRARKLCDHDGLRTTYGAILSLDACNVEAVDGLRRVALDTGNTSLLADVYARYANASRDPDLIASHYVEVGEALESSSAHAAMNAYRQALKCDPDLLSAIRGLGRAAASAGDAKAMVDAARREAAWTRDGRWAAEQLVRAAKLRLERLNDPKGALLDATKALERWPDNSTAADQVHALLYGTREYDRLIALMSRAAMDARSAGRRIALWCDVAALYADAKSNVAAGVAALERLLKSEPKAIAALGALGELYLRQERERDAAGCYLRVLELKPTSEVRAAAHLSLGRLYAGKLADPRRAREHLDALLAIDGNNREALVMIIGVYRKQGNAERAVNVAKRLVEIAGDITERAWSLLTLGELQLQLDQREDAARTLYEAVSYEGPNGQAASLYKQLLGEGEPWERYVAALQAHLDRTNRGEVAPTTRRDTYLAIARIQHEVLVAVDQAIATLRSGLTMCGNDAALHLELATRLGNVGRLDQAVQEYQRIVEHEPVSLEGWRGMARVYHESGRKFESGIALAPLVVFGDATELEAGMARQRRVAHGQAHPASFSAVALQTISAAENWQVEAAITGVLAPLAEALGKLYPSDIQRYGATQRLRPEDPAAQTCVVLAQAFGVEEYEVHVHRSHVTEVVVELGQPRIMVPQYVLELPAGPRVFMLARAFANLARGAHAVLALGAREVARSTTAIVRAFSGSSGGWLLFSSESEGGELGALGKRLRSALSRRNRRIVEAAAPKLLGDQDVDVERWAQSVDLTANRAAAVIAGDLPGAIDMLRRVNPTLAQLSGVPLVRSSAAIADLLRFWAGPPALQLRQRAGIL